MSVQLQITPIPESNKAINNSVILLILWVPNIFVIYYWGVSTDKSMDYYLCPIFLQKVLNNLLLETLNRNERVIIL